MSNAVSQPDLLNNIEQLNELHQELEHLCEADMAEKGPEHVLGDDVPLFDLTPVLCDQPLNEDDSLPDEHHAFNEWCRAVRNARLAAANELVAALQKPLNLSATGQCALRDVLLLMSMRYEIEEEAPSYHGAVYALICRFGDDLPHDGAESDLYPHLLKASLARLRLGSEVAQSFGLDRQHWPVVIRLIRWLQDRYAHEDVLGEDSVDVVELIDLVLARKTLDRSDLRALLRAIRWKRPQWLVNLQELRNKARA